MQTRKKNILRVVVYLFVVFSCFACANGEIPKTPLKVHLFESLDGLSKLKITYINEQRITYVISGNLSKHLRPSCEVNSIANDSAVGDTEVDSDENNEMYPVDEFINDNNNCYVSIRISAIDKKRVNINSVNCPQKDRAACPVKTEIFHAI